jgi:ABC transporter ATM
VKESPQPTPTSKATISNAEQRRRDWSIVRRLLVHIWPKDDWATRGRVVLGVGLLICGKVRLSSLPPPIFARSSLNIRLLLAASERPSPSFFQTSHRHP